MSRNAKIALIILGVLVVGCVVVGVVAMFALRSVGQSVTQSMKSDPAQVSQEASKIADFDLPAGYSQPFAFSMLGVTMVGYTHDDGQSHIFLMQAPAGANMTPEQMEQQMRQGMQNQGVQEGQTKLVSQEPVTVMGQNTTLTVQEITNKDGKTYRTGTAAFQGKSGLSIVMVERPAESWNLDEVKAFLMSFH